MLTNASTLAAATWYPNVQAPNQWIEVNFGVPKFVYELHMAPAHDIPGNFVTKFKLFCGLDGFVVREIATISSSQAFKSFLFGPCYCQIMRLVVLAWMGEIALRWDFVQASG